MTLTEEQIQSNLKAYEHAMRTGSVKDIQTKSENSERAWCECANYGFFPDWLYRIRPTPRLRPWKPEEVPVGAIAKHKTNGFRYLISMAHDDGTNLGDYPHTLDYWEHSTDGGATWKPCGVMEEGE